MKVNKRKFKFTTKQKLEALKRIETINKELKEFEQERLLFEKEDKESLNSEVIVEKKELESDNILVTIDPQVKEIVEELINYLETKAITPPGIFKEEVWKIVFTEVVKFMLNTTSGNKLAEKIHTKNIRLEELYDLKDCPECVKKLEFLNRPGVKIKQF